MSVQGDLGRSGHAAIKAGDDQAALCFFRKAHVHAYPSIEPLVYEGLALALRNLGQFDESLHYLDVGLREHPGHSSLRLIRAQLLLSLNHWPQGWTDYEARFLSPQSCYAPRLLNFPRWRGESLAGKSLLVWGEQGLGDEIMFSTLYDTLSRPTVSHICFECSPRLEPFFSRQFDNVYPRTDDGGMNPQLLLTHFDYEIPAGSIPLARNLSVQGLQDARPHGAIMRACPDKTEIAREIFRKLARGRKIVGLSWKGGTGQTRRYARSLSSAQRDRLLSTCEYSCFFVSLQPDDDPTATHSPSDIINAGYQVYNLDHLAAMVNACDEVVTVCNTNVHLAGILGKPTTVLAPFVPEWRYGLAGKTMPWYDSVQILRQPHYDDWASVLDTVIAHLNAIPIRVS